MHGYVMRSGWHGRWLLWLCAWRPSAWPSGCSMRVIVHHMTGFSACPCMRPCWHGLWLLVLHTLRRLAVARLFPVHAPALVWLLAALAVCMVALRALAAWCFLGPAVQATSGACLLPPPRPSRLLLEEPSALSKRMFVSRSTPCVELPGCPHRCSCNACDAPERCCMANGSDRPLLWPRWHELWLLEPALAWAAAVPYWCRCVIGLHPWRRLRAASLLLRVCVALVSP